MSILGDRDFSNITSQNTILTKKLVTRNLSSTLSDVNVIVANESIFNTLESVTGTIGTLNSTTGTIDDLKSTTGTIGTLNSTTGTIGTLNSTTGTIGTLNSTTGTIGTINGTTGTIGTLNSTTINATRVNATTCAFTDIKMPLASVVQQTSTSTPVTINSSCGTIYTFTSSVPAGNSFSFQVSNNKITQNSVILLTCFYGGLGTPNVRVDTQSILGFCSITVTNVGSVALDETVRIHFLVINSI
jgi:hypothetical protein